MLCRTLVAFVADEVQNDFSIGRDGQGGGAMENGRVLPGEGMFVLRYRELRHADAAAKTENCQDNKKTAQIGSIHALHSI